MKQRIAKGCLPFLGLELLCGEGALVPRPETELLGLAAIEKIKTVSAPLVIDLCCGVGNLACAVATYVPRRRAYGRPISLKTACA